MGHPDREPHRLAVLTIRGAFGVLPSNREQDYLIAPASTHPAPQSRGLNGEGIVVGIEIQPELNRIGDLGY